MKNMKVSKETSHFKILRGVVIVLQAEYYRCGITSIDKIKARLNKARKELQEVCPHKSVAELMSVWTPPKAPKADFINSNGRICLDCGLEELVGDLSGHFYRVLHEPSFFADFYGYNKLKVIQDDPTKSDLVFRSLSIFVEKNSQKEVKP